MYFFQQRCLRSPGVRLRAAKRTEAFCSLTLALLCVDARWVTAVPCECVHTTELLQERRAREGQCRVQLLQAPLEGPLGAVLVAGCPLSPAIPEVSRTRKWGERRPGGPWGSRGKRPSSLPPVPPSLGSTPHPRPGTSTPATRTCCPFPCTVASTGRTQPPLGAKSYLAKTFLVLA